MLNQFEDFSSRFADQGSFETTLIELYEADFENIQPVSSDIVVETKFEKFCQAPVGEMVGNLLDEVISYEDALTYQGWAIEYLGNKYCNEYVNLIEDERHR